MLDIKMEVIYYLNVYKCLLEKRFMIKVQIKVCKRLWERNI